MQVFHIDMNSAAFTDVALRNVLRIAANIGYDTILWEVEDKIKWETCPAVVHADAMDKETFRSLLKYASGLGLASIPLLQSFGHGEYVLMHDEYRTFRELPDRYDCYCASNPDVREFKKKWIHEYLELFGNVKMFHLGGDEAYVFGKCPKCSERNRLELYAEHLMDISGEIRSCGIRPCCWGDMILANPDPKILTLIPKDFVIWDWNYWAGNDTTQKDKWFRNSDLLASLGFDVVRSSATQSFGDDPFLVSWEMHTNNIIESSRKVRGAKFFGHCVTSWSLRGGPKILQYPLMELASIACSSENPKRDVVLKYFGTEDVSLPSKLGGWCSELNILNGIGWTGCKESALPEPDHIAKRLANTGLSEKFLRARALLPSILDGVRKAAAKLESTGCVSECASQWLHGAKLKIRYMEICSSVFGDSPAPSSEELVELRTKTADFYAKEQPRGTAERTAAIVWNPLVDFYAEK